MNDIKYCMNLYTLNYYSWLEDYTYVVKQGKYGNYYQVVFNSEQRKLLLKRVKQCKIKYKIYDKKWERSSNYRKEFFSKNIGPYRCRYCNKLLKKEYVVIDHIFPISKAKYKVDTRIWLYARNISNVNDLRNLAPSCIKCNNKKGDKLGIWYIRGILGKYKWYWKIINIIKIVSTIFLIFILAIFIYQYII